MDPNRRIRVNVILLQKKNPVLLGVKDLSRQTTKSPHGRFSHDQPMMSPTSGPLL